MYAPISLTPNTVVICAQQKEKFATYLTNFCCHSDQVFACSGVEAKVGGVLLETRTAW